MSQCYTVYSNHTRHASAMRAACGQHASTHADHGLVEEGLGVMGAQVGVVRQGAHQPAQAPVLQAVAQACVWQGGIQGQDSRVSRN